MRAPYLKNPRGVSAGKIHRGIGTQGLKAGGAEISEMHGNFIVHNGGAKAEDILALIDLVKEKGSHREGYYAGKRR